MRTVYRHGGALASPLSYPCQSLLGATLAHVPSSSVVARRGCNTTTTTTATSTSSSSSNPPLQQPQRPKGWKFDIEDGVGGFDGFAQPGKGTFDAFINTNKRLKDQAAAQGVSPCDMVGSEAVTEAQAAELLAQVSSTGKLPSPKRSEGGHEATSLDVGATPPASAPAAVAAPAPTPISRSSLPRHQAADRGGAAKTSAAAAKPKTLASSQSREPEYTGGADAAEYYKDMPQHEVTKEQMWARIQSHSQAQTEAISTAIQPEEAEYLKMETEMKENDLYHYRMGEYAFPDETTRRDYWAMWQLAMSLNKARWTQIEVHAQRGVKGTGAGMKGLFWKESLYSIAEKKDMPVGQFVDAHPVLRPFASAVKRAPKVTKAFIRGFADARLRVMPQPGNVKQLLDHFDKSYGYFFNTMLEILDIHDEHAEHVMCHVGRAIGITQHCVVLWKKYAKLGMTMLPADLCADYQVNLALLRNVSLASRDRAVRHVLCAMMAIAKEEMLHALEAAKSCDVRCWPLVMECTYPNYHFGFLQRYDFNVSALLADHGVENPGLWWYRVKKTMEWERKHDISLLLTERAPIPYINCVLIQRESQLRRSPSPKESASNPRASL